MGQYTIEPPTPTQYTIEPPGPDYVAERPGMPAPPKVDMHESYDLGDPNKVRRSMLQQVGDIAEPMAKNLYQVSALGAGASTLKEKFPSLAKYVPNAMLRDATPLQDLPKQIGINSLLMAAGGEEAAGEVTPRPMGQQMEPPASGGAVARAAEVLKRRAGNLPGVRAVKDISYIARGAPQAPPSAAAPGPSVQPIPETNGIPWGSGGQGPISLRGQAIPQATVGTQSGATLDTAIFQAAKDELGPNATISKIAQRAQEIKTTPGEMLDRIKKAAGIESDLQPVKPGTLPRSTGSPYDFKNTPQTMNLHDSTTITKSGYHPDSQTMVVEFRNGKVYEYKGVPQEIYDKFQSAESQGSFHARQIKGRYETNYRGTVLPNK